MGETAIEWTDKVWNPVRGCKLVSPGCTNCYAMRQAHRFAGPGGKYEGLTKLGARGPIWTGEARPAPEMLDAPLRWRKPCRIFVNSMSDLFHEDISEDFIAAVFGVMGMTPWHTYQVLTKRAERLADIVSRMSWDGCVSSFCLEYPGSIEIGFAKPDWPLPNVWLGTSVEDQARADERIPHLLRAPAAVRFVSAEPLLGPVELDLSRSCPEGLETATTTFDPAGYDPDDCAGCGAPQSAHTGIDWVIVGGESGPGARPMHPDWARAIRDRCVEAGVPYFFKQFGEWAPGSNFPEIIPSGVSHDFGDPDLTDDQKVWRVGKKTAGRVLDGATWDQFPPVSGAKK